LAHTNGAAASAFQPQVDRRCIGSIGADAMRTKFIIEIRLGTDLHGYTSTRPLSLTSMARYSATRIRWALKSGSPQGLRLGILSNFPPYQIRDA
jgi:hypothetical protein